MSETSDQTVAPMGDEANRLDIQAIFRRLAALEASAPTIQTVMLRSDEATAILDHIGALAEHLAAAGERLRDAEARAIPAPRLMRTVEEVEACAAGNYLVRIHGRTYPMERGSRPEGGCWFATHLLEWLSDRQLVGCWIQGPLPDILIDLPIPTTTEG